jgi:hypothetical protein
MTMSCLQTLQTHLHFKQLKILILHAKQYTPQIALFFSDECGRDIIQVLIYIIA